VKAYNETEILARLCARFAAADYLVSAHASREMEDEAITTLEIEFAVTHGQVLENYPDAKRGPCCLISGDGGQGRPVHVVVTSLLDPPVIITVYEPKAPKWITATQRGRKGTS
jgi:hypothetical protein